METNGTSPLTRFGLFSSHSWKKPQLARCPSFGCEKFSKLIFFTLWRWTVFVFLNFISWFGSSPVFTTLHQALHLIPPVWASKIIELLFTFQCSRSIFLSFQKFIWNFFQCSWSSFFTRRCFKEGAWQTIGDREVRFWLFCCIFKRTWFEIDLKKTLHFWFKFVFSGLKLRQWGTMLCSNVLYGFVCWLSTIVKLLFIELSLGLNRV